MLSHMKLDSLTRLSQLLRLIATSLLLAVLGVLSGCATPANQAAMTISVADQKTRNLQMLGVFGVGNVTGGQETNPMWTSQVGNEAFRAALEQSLKGIKYHSESKSPYLVIHANLNRLEQPFIGINFDVVSHVTYRIEGSGFSKAYEVTSKATATFGESPLAVERLRIANEKSIKQNIIDFIERVDNDKAITEVIAKAQSSTKDKQASEVEAKCLELGFTRATDGFRNCVARLSL